VQDSLEEKLAAIECESETVDFEWNNIKQCVVGTVSDIGEESRVDYTGSDQYNG
jgi:hypothetical protein